MCFVSSSRMQCDPFQGHEDFSTQSVIVVMHQVSSKNKKNKSNCFWPSVFKSSWIGWLLNTTHYGSKVKPNYYKYVTHISIGKISAVLHPQVIKTPHQLSHCQTIANNHESIVAYITGKIFHLITLKNKKKRSYNIFIVNWPNLRLQCAKLNGRLSMAGIKLLSAGWCWFNR